MSVERRDRERCPALPRRSPRSAVQGSAHPTAALGPRGLFTQRAVRPGLQGGKHPTIVTS